MQKEDDEDDEDDEKDGEDDKDEDDEEGDKDEQKAGDHSSKELIINFNFANQLIIIRFQL